MVVMTTLAAGLIEFGLEPLDGVERRELARIVGRLEVGELVLGLLAEIAAIHQEQDALGAGELEQAIGDVDGGEGLARAGRHLDEGARIGPGEGLFEVADRLRLDLPEPRLVERRQLLEPGAELRRLRHPFGQRLGPREVEDLPAARHRIEAVGEEGHRAVGLEQERQRAPVRRQVVRQAGGVLGRLRSTPVSVPPAWLRPRRRLAVEIEQVVREAEAGFIGNSRTAMPRRGEVEFVAALNSQPAAASSRRFRVGLFVGCFRHPPPLMVATREPRETPQGKPTVAVDNFLTNQITWRG